MVTKEVLEWSYVEQGDLKEYLHMGDELKSVIAFDIMKPIPKCLTPGQRLDEALPVLLEAEMRNVPVINNRVEKKLIGAVNRAEALGQLAEAMTASSLRLHSEKTESKNPPFFEVFCVTRAT